MRLHLIRHAKTNQFSPTGRDFDRQLMQRGWNQCVDLDLFLSKKELQKALVYCSSAVRTRETLEGICKNFNAENIQYHEDLYLCSFKTYLNHIWAAETGEDLVMIGHNFGISDLANYFLGGQMEMGTSEYVCISFPFQNWTELFQDTGELVDRFRSKAE